MGQKTRRRRSEASSEDDEFYYFQFHALRPRIFFLHVHLRTGQLFGTLLLIELLPFLATF